MQRVDVCSTNAIQNYPLDNKAARINGIFGIRHDATPAWMIYGTREKTMQHLHGEYASSVVNFPLLQRIFSIPLFGDQSEHSRRLDASHRDDAIGQRVSEAVPLVPPLVHVPFEKLKYLPKNTFRTFKTL